MDVVSPEHGLADLFVLAVTDDPALELAFEWADQKPDERGYPHLIAAFMAMCRAIETYQGAQP